MVTFLITLVAILNAIPPYGGFKTAKSAMSDNKVFCFLQMGVKYNFMVKKIDGDIFKYNGRHLERHSAIWRL